MTLFSGSASAQYAPNIWDVLRRQFELNHEVRRPEVQKQIKWIVSHPTYLKRLSHSEPYIYHILSEVRKRRLPGEIALIPIIESAYDPFAYSGAGASGLWQIMPSTGRGLGLKQDWWRDGRRSVDLSTNAALSYLSYLNKYFKGNWLLAFAAYDSGEGTIGRLIRKSGQTRKPNFWSLPVPRETKGYIPRLLALAAIIQNPNRYNVTLPEIPHAPYFEKVNVGSQIDLNHAAKLANISYEELIKLNPEYNRWTTAPYHPYKLLIPVDKVKEFSRKLAALPKEERVSWKKHKVAKGESLVIIAKKHHTTVKLIKELNQLKSTTVHPEQTLLIPSNTDIATSKQDNNRTIATDTSLVASKKIKVIHVVQKKDTFDKITKRYGVSESDIKSWNFIGPHVPLTPGQNLVIWRKKSTQTPSFYTVAKGDSLGRIAQKNHLKMDKLIKLNPHISKHLIKPGQQIALK
jgi:membrane-bound lytic murein transglycosylase D